MPDPLAIAGIGLQAGGIIAGALEKRRQREELRRATASLRASRPQGYLTGEDLRAAELTRGRLNRALQTRGELAGYEIRRRTRARGLAGSPTEERDLARLEQGVLLGKEQAGEAAEEQLYNTRLGREIFERQKELAIFGAETGAAAAAQQRRQAQQSEYWNSLNKSLEMLAFLTAPGGAPPEAGGAYEYTGFDPNSPTFWMN